MIFKLVGCAAIVCATTALGMGKSRELRQRTEELEAFSNAAALLATEMRFTRTPLKEAFKKLEASTCDTVKRFFYAAAACLDDPNGVTASKAWQTALEETKPVMALNEEDIRSLRGFGVSLGNTDVEGQLAGIAALQERLSLRLADAVERRDKNQRLFTNLGVYAGLLICILLF